MKRLARTSRAFFPLRLAAAALLLAAAGIGAAAVTPPPDRVQVAWPPAEQLSEVKDNPINHGWMRPQEWQKSLSDHLRKRADRLLPPGEQLQVTIDDIKLAGSFEPWHTRPGLEDVRFMKDIYPPRIDLHYRLIGNDGATIREGDAKLRDNAYLQRDVGYNSNDALRFDKRLIDEWLRKEFGAARS